jgi:siroheme synthase-like protein
MNVNNLLMVALKIQDKSILVVGGGSVAEQKVRQLVGSGARVRLISPRLTPYLQQLANRQEIQWERRVFQKKDVKSAQLIFCATNDGALNQTVFRLGTRAGAWVNVVDKPDLCHFYMPATARKGSIVVSVSTGGASPALAGELRNQLSRKITEEHVKLAAALKYFRPAFRDLPQEKKMGLLKKIIRPAFMAGLKSKTSREIKTLGGERSGRSGSFDVERPFRLGPGRCRAL